MVWYSVQMLVDSEQWSVNQMLTFSTSCSTYANKWQNRFLKINTGNTLIVLFGVWRNVSSLGDDSSDALSWQHRVWCVWRSTRVPSSKQASVPCLQHTSCLSTSSPSQGNAVGLVQYYRCAALDSVLQVLVTFHFVHLYDVLHGFQLWEYFYVEMFLEKHS